MGDAHFRVNTPQVIHEVIEGEAILINLQSGAYFSIDPVGTAVWDALARGLSVDEIVAQLAGQYTGEPGQIREAVEALMAELEGEMLIVRNEASGSAAPGPPLPGNGAEKPTFAAPVLSKYTDIADLLLLDPIHDVDESGWPTADPGHAA